jgi:hypothetical protein
MALELTQSQTEISTRTFLEGDVKARPARKADSFTAISEPMV